MNTSATRAVWAALFALVLALAGFSPVAADEGDGGDGSQPFQIEEGVVVWGIKASWRKYIGPNGTHLEGGVEETDSGEYQWPIKSGTYDPKTKTLNLDLAGSAHFQAYHDHDDYYLADSSDPRGNLTSVSREPAVSYARPGITCHPESVPHESEGQ